MGPPFSIIIKNLPVVSTQTKNRKDPMSLKTTGYGLVGIAAIAFAYVVMQLMFAFSFFCFSRF
jgi:hypothetical protein